MCVCAWMCATWQVQWSAVGSVEGVCVCICTRLRGCVQHSRCGGGLWGSLEGVCVRGCEQHRRWHARFLRLVGKRPAVLPQKQEAARPLLRAADRTLASCLQVHSSCDVWWGQKPPSGLLQSCRGTGLGGLPPGPVSAGRQAQVTSCRCVSESYLEPFLPSLLAHTPLHITTSDFCHF